MEVVLGNGVITSIRFEHGMYRSDINGIHYCAPDLQTLESIIARFQSAIIPEIAPEPVRPLADVLYDKLRSSKLEDKQDARRRLLQMVKNGDASAIQYLDKLPVNPLSTNAKYIAMAVGKEFEDLTFADLSQFVPDLVLREKLMKELEGRFKLC